MSMKHAALCYDIEISYTLQIHIGPRLSMLLPVSPTPLNDFSVEYGALECNVEVVDSLQDAVQVIIAMFCSWYRLVVIACVLFWHYQRLLWIVCGPELG
jgi:gamma-glutamyl phosphate reductase